MGNVFISNTRLKSAKYQAKAKQNPEAEHLPLEKYSHSLSMLSRNDREYSKKYLKKTSVSVFVRLMINHNENEK